MITTENIKEILFDQCDKLKWHVAKYMSNNMPFQEINEEALVIVCHEIKPDTYWLNCYVDINWCVPDIKGEPDSIRLGEVEKKMSAIFEGLGEYENTCYKYRRASISQEEDERMRCHYVNVRLLFKILNIM